MAHDGGLIATIGVGIGLAFVLGFLATRIRLPAIVGYLVAGVCVGPFTPGFVANAGLASQLAEIGVILLMFGVGIHFSVGDLLAVRRIAIPGAVAQIGVSTLLGAGMCSLWGWSWKAGIVFGLCLSVASTVVLLRGLEARDMLGSVEGRIAVGWLVVEDLATVVVLVLLPLTVSIGSGAGEGGTGHIVKALAVTVGKVAVFVTLMFVVGKRAVPWLLVRVARTGSRELFTLAVLAVALGIALGASALFDVSFALGAFFAGMVVNGSELSHEAAENALPLQDAFSVLFFVAVGMLFDPVILVREPLRVLAVFLVITVGKSLAAFLIVVVFRYPLRTALTISASLAQVGEFSFILAALGVRLGLLPAEGESLVVAGALLTISLNPVAFWAAERLRRAIEARPRLLAVLERSGGDLPAAATDGGEGPRDHAIVLGYGRVGSAIGEALAAGGVPHVIVELNRSLAESLRSQGKPAIYGDAARPGVLSQAGVERARLLVIAIPDPLQAKAIIGRARSANPKIRIVARTHSEQGRQYLEEHGADLALVGEHELALSLARNALAEMTTAEPYRART